VLRLEGLKPPREKAALFRAVSFLRPYLLGVAGSAYLFSVGWVRWKNRAAIVELSHHFGYHHESREPAELPVITLRELVPGDSLVDVRAIDAVDGNVSEYELITICRLVQAIRPGALFEFGTFDGRTTLNLAVNAGPDAKVCTLDLPASGVDDTASPIHRHELRYASKASSGERYRGTDAEGRIVQLYGDSGTVDFGPYYGRTDFVFIDASHTFDYVVNDSLHALRMLRSSGGTIVWHDYGRWDGVTAALNQLRLAHESFGAVAHIAGTTLAVLAVPAKPAKR
jgi:predicted O-methyltransferase YrrM